MTTATEYPPYFETREGERIDYAIEPTGSWYIDVETFEEEQPAATGERQWVHHRRRARVLGWAAIQEVDMPGSAVDIVPVIALNGAPCIAPVEPWTELRGPGRPYRARLIQVWPPDEG